jgi:hypothetical protein
VDAVRRACEALGITVTFGDDAEGSAAEEEGAASEVRCWKIAPGSDGVLWEAWRARGVATIGWGDLGDLTAVEDELAFERRLQEVHPGETIGRKDGIWQAHKFRGLREGDLLAANIGTHTVLGFGRVVRGYQHVTDNPLLGDSSHSDHVHRVAVEWFDVTPRRVTEMGWRRTLVELTQEKLERLREAPEKG